MISRSSVTNLLLSHWKVIGFAISMLTSLVVGKYHWVHIIERVVGLRFIIELMNRFILINKCMSILHVMRMNEQVITYY